MLDKDKIILEFENDDFNEIIKKLNIVTNSWFVNRTHKVQQIRKLSYRALDCCCRFKRSDLLIDLLTNKLPLYKKSGFIYFSFKDTNPAMKDFILFKTSYLLEKSFSSDSDIIESMSMILNQKIELMLCEQDKFKSDNVDNNLITKFFKIAVNANVDVVTFNYIFDLYSKVHEKILKNMFKYFIWKKRDLFDHTPSVVTYKNINHVIYKNMSYQVVLDTDEYFNRIASQVTEVVEFKTKEDSELYISSLSVVPSKEPNVTGESTNNIAANDEYREFNSSVMYNSRALSAFSMLSGERDNRRICGDDSSSPSSSSASSMKNSTSSCGLSSCGTRSSFSELMP